MIRFLIKNRVGRVAPNQSGSTTPARTATATASILVRTRSFEQTFSKYPDAVADMLKVAQHRGWTQVRVSGDETFRREAWVQARALGVDVKGYQPRDRDRQAAGDKVREPPTGPDRSAGPSAISAERRLKEAAIVVRRLITDPAAQARLIEHAYQRARDMIPGLPRHPDGDRSPRRESDRIRR